MLMQEAGAEGYVRETPSQIIHREKRWFGISGADALEPPRPRVVASRWTGEAPTRREQESEIEPDCHVLGIALQPIDDVTIYGARKLISSGPLPAGSMRLNEPGLPMRGIFLGGYDVLHLHIPNVIVAEAAECGEGRTTPLITDHPVVDPVIERLARAFVHAEALGGPFGLNFAEGISLAITAQLFGARPAGTTDGPRVSSLSKWRLKRATDFIEANLDEAIGLAEVAAAAGLSRMHFAAQFRAATGLRPHEYLIRRRVERAKVLLRTTQRPLVEIALDVGFRTQAHFTTVFGRLVGETPNIWRQHIPNEH